MVVKGRGKVIIKPPALVIPKMSNPFIGSISALKKKPHQQRATDLLYEIADIVTPIMKEYNFKVKLLREFSPENPNLLGTNWGKGITISLRLRPSGRDDEFLSLDDLIGTMLHELTHNLYSAHDSKFYKQLDELISKQEDYIRKGITGKNSGFGGDGAKLGGAELLNQRAIRDARIKKLHRMYTMGVEKLGGADKKGNLRDLVREAAIKRYEDNKWCNHGGQDQPPGNDDLIIADNGDNNGDNDEEVEEVKAIDRTDKIDNKRLSDPLEKGQKRQKLQTQKVIVVEDQGHEIEVIDLT